MRCGAPAELWLRWVCSLRHQHVAEHLLEDRGIDVLEMSSLVPTVGISRHIRVHVADHDDYAVLLAIQAVHSVIITSVPCNDLPFFPTVLLSVDHQPCSFQALDTQVDVQDGI